jgi:glycerate kinase
MESSIALLPNGVAFVEMAQAAGLTLLEEAERDPMRASSFGVGQLIKAALDEGAREIWVGLGGSATVDGGLGMLQALGVELRDPDGQAVPAGGRGLSELASIDASAWDRRLAHVKLKALCDVESVLLGPQGAELYMPQKGATSEQIPELTRGLGRFADLVARHSERDVRNISGAGAAGGLGASLAFLGADLVSGSRFVMDALEVDRKLASCDLVVTGEGTIDEQTLQGKTIGGLADRCRTAGRPLVALCGRHAGDLSDLQTEGMAAVFSIVPGAVSREAAMAEAGRYLEQTAHNLGAVVRVVAELDAR